MRIDVFHHLEFEDIETNRKLDKILLLLRDVQREEHKMALDLTEITARVDEAVTIETGTATLIAWIVAQLEASKTDPAKIQELANKLKGGTQVLSDAVANVPPEDQPPA